MMTEPSPESNVFGALNKEQVAKKIYAYIREKIMDAYNMGEDEFFMGYKMIVRDLNIQVSQGGTFTFGSMGKEGDPFDIRFAEEPCADFVFKVARILMRNEKDKIKKIDLTDDIIRVTFY